MYKYSQITSEDELELRLSEGWSKSIEEAAKLCGPSAIFKKRVKKNRGVNKYAKGLPLTLPSQEEIPTEVYEVVKKVEDPIKSNGSLSPEKLEEANYLIDSGKKLKDVAKKYGVSWQYLVSKRRNK
jgi:hypothetical protein